MKLYINGKEAVRGMSVTTFRGEAAVLIDWWEPETASGGSGGRVYIKEENGSSGAYFPGVIGGEFRQN